MRDGKYARYEFQIVKHLAEKSTRIHGLKKKFPNIERIDFHETLGSSLKIPRSSYNDVINKLTKNGFVDKLYLNNSNYSVLLGLTKKGFRYFESIQ